ncbi:MAG: hypothetical protein HY000_08820 [Planctomycetes bacterium]|nr:hypothetical protein [Planctomycetota bacterium]
MELIGDRKAIEAVEGTEIETNTAVVEPALQSAAVRPGVDRLLPLHLTPLELFMCADDRPAFPMTFAIVVRLSGTIDRGAFEAALEDTLERHPLLTAVVRSAKSGRPCWVSAKNARPTVNWQPASGPIPSVGWEPIDIVTETGLRIWARATASHCELVLQFHHAAADGVGAYRVIGDLLAAYSIHAAGGGAARLAPVDPAQLRRRMHAILAAASCKSSRRLVWQALRTTARILARRIAPLTPPRRGRAAGEPVGAVPVIATMTLDRAAHERLRSAAADLGGTLNDLLLTALFQTLDAWNSRHGALGRGQSLRIMMPTDLRGQEEYDMPAATLTGYTFLTRKARDCLDTRTLLRTVRDETAAIKRERLGTRFVDFVTALAKLPWLLRLAVQWNRCMATAVLSNVGDPSRRFTASFPRVGGRCVCGNLVLEEITGTGPMRPKTRTSFNIFTYNRQLTICNSCDPHRFSADDTHELLALYVAQLRKHAAI